MGLSGKILALVASLITASAISGGVSAAVAPNPNKSVSESKVQQAQSNSGDNDSNRNNTGRGSQYDDIDPGAAFA